MRSRRTWAGPDARPWSMPRPRSGLPALLERRGRGQSRMRSLRACETQGLAQHRRYERPDRGLDGRAGGAAHFEALPLDAI